MSNYEGKVGQLTYLLEVRKPPEVGMTVLFVHRDGRQQLWEMNIPGWMEMKEHVYGAWRTRTCPTSEFLCKYIGKQEKDYNIQALGADPETRNFAAAYHHAVNAVDWSGSGPVSHEKGMALVKATLEARANPKMTDEYIERSGALPQELYEEHILTPMHPDVQEDYRKRGEGEARP